ncbi:hypothetical protein Bind_2314 [Beijerinckia indica subsp. indica ATCC 9039]|uniref:NB-ARC domain-containing protein n=1 Tax=Beijerinckia indica subsp. indica (strain ATCC 9039 / DSM 1715 / NCIMB 8712) TaxID=395963 RepID=B2IHE2_BEII9|nr:hypothetical protein Bind_2314 [Beijerinckia indica subsp. indica ATCC 9039]
MNPQTRKLLIQRLIEPIGMIGPEFERFGELFLDHLLSTPLEHSGLNVLGFPVSRVLDSSAADGAIVAEYSAENDYFTKGMPKAQKDIAHALSHRPNVRLVLLIAAQPSHPQIVEKFLQVAMAGPGMKERSLRIWGAERIAEQLVDKITFNDSAVEALSAYLPVLTEIWEEAARDRLFPAPDPRHRRRPTVSAQIHCRLTTETCVILGGIAGSGKSDTVAAYGADHRMDYDLLIWFDGDEISRVDDLRAAPLMRGREKRNIASLMRTRRCLLVIDDPKNPLEASALAALCGPGTHVLVTTRELRPDVYAMPSMSAAEARAILDADVPASCPQNVFDTIWATVGGHPLSLALMNGAVRDGAPWCDIQEDCSAVGQLADPKQRLADRLLLRRRDLLQAPLAVFEWAGQPECDEGFLRFAVKPAGIRNLRTHALTAADRDAVVRLHDVVFSSLSSLDWWTPVERNQLNDKLEAYLVAASEANDLSLRAAAGSLRKRLEALIAAGDGRPAFLLALLMAWTPEEIDPIPLGDPAAKASAFAAAKLPIAHVEFRLLIETVEQLFLRVKIEGEAATTAFLDNILPMFDSLAQLPSLSPRQTAEIHHHRGKVYRRLHRDADAQREFETVIAGPSPLDATRLQLIRLYKSANKCAAAAELGKEVLTAAEDTGDVAPSVLLAVIQDLPWRDASVRAELLLSKQDFIEQTIVSYANAGYDQAYKTLAAVARWWSQEAPEVLERVLKAIPALSAERVDDDESRFAFGDILLEASRASGAGVAENQKLALSFFEAEVQPHDFHIQRHAELLLDMGRHAEAEVLLGAHQHFASSCWIQRLMARARLAQDDAPTALTWINRALADDRCSSRHDEFLELRYEIRRALGEASALEDLSAAVNLSAAGPRRSRLEAMLAAATA